MSDKYLDSFKATDHHFIVCVQREEVIVYEQYKWDNGLLGYDADMCVTISQKKWKLINKSVEEEFNSRIKKKGLPTQKFKFGNNPISRTQGKELCILLWAIQHTDEEEQIITAVKRWRGLEPTERWWLHSKAKDYDLNANWGWRAALHHALCYEPGKCYA